MTMKQLLVTLAIVLVSSIAVAQTTSENYVKSTTYQVETTTGNVSSNDDKIESISYFDGLGRPMQSIGIRAGGNKQDIITPVVYDGFGRQDKDYLPYSRTSSSLNYQEQNTTFFNNLNTQYSTKYPNDINASVPNPYSEKHIESSPLSRILEQGAPGEDWAVNKNSDSDYTIKFEYASNTASEVKFYEVTLNTSNGYAPSLIIGANYNANELYKTITKDENWQPGQTHPKDHTTEEFKDKQGRVVLKRTYNDNSPHDTYYVYDDFGNLTYVLPPKASDILSAGNNAPSTITSTAIVTSGNNLVLEANNSIILSDGFHATSGSTFTATINSHQNVLDELCYQYKYDDRNRLIEKKIPGKGWEYIVYDKLDRPVLTQDANLNADNKWLFTKYDAFGRVAYTGMYTHSANIDQAAMQNYFNGQNPNANNMFESKVSSGTGYDNSYYTNNNFPDTNIELYTINYYDDYSFNKDGLSIPATNTDGIAIVNHNNTDLLKTKGLPTGSKVKVLTTSNWITTITGYDKKGQVLYTASKNSYLNTTNVVTIELDFVGKPTKTTTTHSKTGQNTITTIDTFTYDHIGRLLAQKQKINSQSDELIVLNSYDELGQLEHKKVGGNVAGTIENSTGLQTVDYTYNIRGWLKQINNPSSLGSDLFGFNIKYNEGNDALYNGNISSTQWKTANTDNSLKTYNYTYDALNRITSAIDDINRYSLTGVNYDKNGNILSLLRKGHIVENPVASISSHFNVMDNLSYSYDIGNKLLSVTDAINTPTAVKGEFKDGNKSGDDFVYDDNGNMTSDKNKDINSITYNHLNLPTEVTFDDPQYDSAKITYIYDATGVKLRKTMTVMEGGPTPSQYQDTYYAGNYVYQNGLFQPPSLKFFNHPEGYVDAESGYEYVYQYKDHLGNIRLSYKDNNGNLEILEENNYYPFGLKHKGYNNIVNSSNKALDWKYNGIEYEESLGLNLYEMDVRSYDPAIARWTSIDPVVHYDFSPYQAFDNNPIFWADPSGADSETSDIIQNIFNASSSGMTWYNTGNGGFSTTDPEDSQDNDNDKEKNKRIRMQANALGEYISVTYELVDDKKNIHKITIKGSTRLKTKRRIRDPNRVQKIEIIIESNKGNPRVVSTILTSAIYDNIKCSIGEKNKDRHHSHYGIAKKFPTDENHNSELSDFFANSFLDVLNQNPDHNPFNGQVLTPEWLDSTMGGVGVYESVTGRQVISRILGPKTSKRLYAIFGGIWLGNKFRANWDHSGRKVEFKLDKQK